jgi:hypothetical protein
MQQLGIPPPLKKCPVAMELPVMRQQIGLVFGTCRGVSSRGSMDPLAHSKNAKHFALYTYHYFYKNINYL